LLRIPCIFLGASLFFLSLLFCIVCCNKWLDHIMFILERYVLHFHCQEHSSFHSYRSTSSLFLVLRLAFVFHLDFFQILLYICIKVYLDHWYILVFISKEWL
jgi:hypothetical protein